MQIWDFFFVYIQGIILTTCILKSIFFSIFKGPNLEYDLDFMEGLLK